MGSGCEFVLQLGLLVLALNEALVGTWQMKAAVGQEKKVFRQVFSEVAVGDRAPRMTPRAPGLWSRHSRRTIDIPCPRCLGLTVFLRAGFGVSRGCCE